MSTKRGNMFVVDVPTFAAVCDLSDADVAATYLILAAGTGSDNRTSSWSREAVNRRTALNWRKANTCIDRLEKAGLISWISPKNTRKTRIDLPPVNGERRPAFLPKSLVENVVDRIRMAREPMAFRLLVDLYALQDLAECAGVDHHHLYETFRREEAGATPSLQAWYFNSPQKWVRWTPELAHHQRQLTAREVKAGEDRGSNLFARVSILADAGALEWVHYLAEDEESGSPLIHPVDVVRHGKVIDTEIETIVGSFATLAAMALTGRNAPAFGYLLAADRLAKKVALVGIPRLRHRAHTANAARWHKNLMEDAQKAVAVFRDIIVSSGMLTRELAEAEQRLADFNDTSTLLQREFNETSTVFIESPQHGSVYYVNGGADAPQSDDFGFPASARQS